MCVPLIIVWTKVRSGPAVTNLQSGQAPRRDDQLHELQTCGTVATTNSGRLTPGLNHRMIVDATECRAVPVSPEVSPGLWIVSPQTPSSS